MAVTSAEHKSSPIARRAFGALLLVAASRASGAGGKEEGGTVTVVYPFVLEPG